MAENKRELLEHYGQLRRELLAAVSGLSDEMLTEQSLDGWSVKDHLAHIAFWDGIRAEEVTRISAGHASAWRVTPDREETLNEIAYESYSGLKLNQVRWELETSRRRLLDAISAATERGLDRSLYGESALCSSHESEHAGWIKRWRQEKGL